ncbi:SDR family NAD(P)-dependent oxidoreductase [Sphingomonas adhaesiva]|uniref:SDR family NAD(P)-dependent oxidoreductase n=1 Tax=Sphingomonas adhaesiva TaxID=28212 RepID=UPI002FF80F21
MAARPPRTAIVTGTASGIGAAIAHRLAADGWRVVGVDRARIDDAAHLAAQVTLDLADIAAIPAALAPHVGAVALVHAAGVMRTGTLETLDPADGATMWALHVAALTAMAQAIVPAMDGGGRIVAIGSRTSAGAAGKSQYAAVKAAMVGLIRSWAIELAPRGITANVIAPAATATPLLARADRAAVPPVLPPIGRYVEPAEVAAYAAFLLSPDAGAITGQQLLICGGASL